MINQEILTSEEKKQLKYTELAEFLELRKFPSAKISDSEKLEYIKFMLENHYLFSLCGGGDVQVAMARNLVRIKNKKRN